MNRLVSWWDTHQITLYLAAIAAGATLGLAAPGLAPTLEHSIGGCKKNGV